MYVGTLAPGPTGVMCGECIDESNAAYLAAVA
jgi:hypothetical protein